MKTATVIELRGARSWEPFDLHPPRFEIARGGKTVPLLEVALQVAPMQLTDVAGLVIRDGDIDKTGRIVDGTRKTPYRGYRVDPLADEASSGLRPGDVLVPSNPGTPAILVSEQLGTSIVFTPSFTVFRPVDIHPLMLWAALSSQTGIRAREEAAAFQTSNSPGRLWPYFYIDEKLLSFNPEQLERIRLLLPEPVVELRETAPPTSKWSEQALQAFPTWEHAIRRVGHKDPADGIPLSDLAEITGGAPSTRNRRANAPTCAELPLAHEEVLVQPGDLVINSRRPGRDVVQIADAVRPANASEVRIRANSPVLTEKIARYLLSEAGEARLRERYIGVHPHLSLRELASFTIPRGVIEAPLDRPGPVPNLSQSLEDALWTT